MTVHQLAQRLQELPDDLQNVEVGLVDQEIGVYPCTEIKVGWQGWYALWPDLTGIDRNRANTNEDGSIKRGVSLE